MHKGNYCVKYYQTQVWLLFVPQAPLVVVEMARLILHPRALEVLSAPLKQKSCSRFLTITHLKGNLAAVARFWAVAAEAWSWAVAVACFWVAAAACSSGVVVAS